MDKPLSNSSDNEETEINPDHQPETPGKIWEELDAELETTPKFKQFLNEVADEIEEGSTMSAMEQVLSLVGRM